MIEIDVNIVEIVTKGLFINSLDIFREYIQNSCDAIDDAVEAGIFQEGDGKIEITIGRAARRITIEDNGMGIPTRYFERTMSRIGNSDKTLETDRGFRGIGRLCGLAYCKEMRFSSTAKGETKLSVMIIDAERLRREFFRNNNRSAESVLRDVITFGKNDAEVNDHFFRVELIDIVDTNKDLLDVEKVRDYLSFVAPVTYSPQFHFQTQIYKHAAALNFKLAEYKILVNGEPVVKNYKTSFNTFRNGADKIFDVYFRDFFDAEGNLIAWSWIGLSTFKAVISELRETTDYKMRCIRLRTGNIQIGNAETLKHLFIEPRGIKYFIGEVHVVDTNLIPNSRRDYFEENDACNALEIALREYFVELHNIYHYALEIKGAFHARNRLKKFEQKVENHPTEYREKHNEEHSKKLAELKENANKKEYIIYMGRLKVRDNPEALTSRIFKQITQNNESTPSDTLGKSNPSRTRLPLPRWSDERKKLYNEIYEIILANPKLAGDKLIEKFEESLK